MLQIQHICKEYKTGKFTQKALDDVSLKLRENEFVAILGEAALERRHYLILSEAWIGMTAGILSSMVSLQKNTKIAIGILIGITRSVSYFKAII